MSEDRPLAGLRPRQLYVRELELTPELIAHYSDWPTPEEAPVTATTATATCPACGHTFHFTPCAPVVPEEPPVGTWMKDRFGGVTQRQPGGWGAPGVEPFGRWEAMWAARGPYVECGPWGADLPAEHPAG